MVRRSLVVAALAWGVLVGGTEPAMPAPAKAEAEASAGGRVHTVTVKLETPKKANDKRVSLPLDEVSCSLYVPPHAKVLRGVVFNPFYEKTVEQAHWRTAVGLWDFGLMGSNLFRVRNDEVGDTVLAGLARLAEATGRPELAHAPLCLVGMSIGGGLTSRLTEALPDRIIAAGPVCLEVGPRDDASGRVPMITIFGERDGRQMEILARKLPEARARGARWATAVQWGRRHEFARANNLLMPLFDRAIRYRYPPDRTPRQGPVPLKSHPEEAGWVGDPATWREPAPTIAPVKDYRGDASQACWLPDGYVAAVWQAFVVREPKLTIISPAGLGDGKPFSPHRADEPILVEVRLAESVPAERVDIFDGDRRLGTLGGKPLALRLERLEPGVHALIAIATTQDGERFVSRPNTILVVGS
jgi:hypothetical protein